MFWPKRWLIIDFAQNGAIQDTLELISGHGSTICLVIAMMELSKMIFEIDFVIVDRSLLHVDELLSIIKKL